MPPGAVYVGRPSRFGNPYRRDPYGIADVDGEKVSAATQRREAQAMAVRDFEMWLRVTPNGQAMLERAKRELRGKDLACWCPIGSPCHADVLLRVANEP